MHFCATINPSPSLCFTVSFHLPCCNQQAPESPPPALEDPIDLVSSLFPINPIDIIDPISLSIDPNQYPGSAASEPRDDGAQGAVQEVRPVAHRLPTVPYRPTPHRPTPHRPTNRLLHKAVLVSVLVPNIMCVLG